MSVVAYRLGAEELIELGKPGRPKPFLSARKPYFQRDRRASFLGNGSRAGLGQLDLLAQVGSFLAKFLSGAFSVLAQIVNVPANILASGVNLIFTNVASLIEDVPIIGTVAAQIFLIANSIIKFGLQVPGELLGGISNVFEGIGKALDTLAPSKKAAAETDAKNKIMERTPDGLKEAVSAALSGTHPAASAGGYGGVPGASTPIAAGASSGAVGAGSGLDTAIAVGAVAVAGGTLLLLLT